MIDIWLIVIWGADRYSQFFIKTFGADLMKRLAVISLAVLALGGCASTNPLLVTRTSCPAVAIVKYANALTSFRAGAGMDQSDVDFTAQISNVSVNCRNGQGDTAAQTDVSFDIGVQRGNADAASQAMLPYFVSVIQDGTTILSKTTYLAQIDFASKSGRTSSRQTFKASTPGVPLPPVQKKKRGDSDVLLDPDSASKAAKYEILIGFQLTDDQALFNISK
jgi:hypothetical protein